eukprot:10006329-Karenia_brevis.AAC.1
MAECGQIEEAENASQIHLHKISAKEIYPVKSGNRFRLPLTELAMRQPDQDSIKSTKSRYTKRNTSDE